MTGIIISDIITQFTDPLTQAQSDRLLLADPDFCRLYESRYAPPLPPLDVMARLPVGSLGETVAAFCAHYGLVPGFFPGEPPKDPASPTEYGAHRLWKLHDILHVLCEYETSDQDEFALQSFVCAQTPGAFARFLQQSLAAPDILLPRYKHLRDVAAAPLAPLAMERGRRARWLIAWPLEDALNTPLSRLREALWIPKRGVDQGCGPNTCSIDEPHSASLHKRPFFGSYLLQQSWTKTSSLPE